MKLNAEQKIKRFADNIVSTNNECLVTLQLDLTDYCVCKCKGCEHWQWPKKTKLDTITLNKNVFEHLPHTIQSIVLSGGEPLLHPDVEIIVETLKQDHGKNIGIITSGLGKNNLDWSLLSQNCSWIRFSSDGFNKKNYATTRGVDLFDQWLINLKTLVYENTKTQCQTRINVTIHEYNIDNFYEGLIDLLIDQKLNINVYFWLSRELIDAFRKDSNDSRASSISVKIAKLRSYADSLKFDINNLNFDNVCKHINLQDTINYTSCFIPQIFALIASDGNVFPCCYMYEPVFSIDNQQLNFVIGNVNEQTLEDIYKSQKFKDVVKQFRECNKKFTQCKFCDRFDHINKYLNDYHLVNIPVFL